MADSYYKDQRYINLANTYWYNANVNARKGRVDDCNLMYINDPNVPGQVARNVFTFKTDVCPGNLSADSRATISDAELASVSPAKNPYLQDPNSVSTITNNPDEMVCYSLQLKDGGRDGQCEKYDPTKYSSPAQQQQAMLDRAKDYQDRLGNLPEPQASFPTAYVLVGGVAAIALILWATS